MTSAAPPALAVEGLSVTLHRGAAGQRVLIDVSLSVARGETLAVLGQSGSGKSTLALAILGLLDPEARPVVRGAIHIDGAPMLGAAPARVRAVRRERLGVVFQDPIGALDPTMRIGAQLAQAARGAGDPALWLERVAIADPGRVGRAWPHELSGGQCQRVMIAMALARRPGLIIADEPSTALDVITQAQILRLLGALAREEGVGLLFITHDLGVASVLADRVAVMRRGRIVETGPFEAVIRRPAHPYTRALLAARIALDTDRTRPLPVAADNDGRGDGNGDGGEGLAGPPRAWPPAADRPANLALEMAGIEKTFPGRGLRGKPVPVLKGVDLRIRRGEAVALVGASGSGKSTLLRIAAGLERATAGDIALPSGAPQMVFQDAAGSFTPWLSIGSQIAERLAPLRLAPAERRERVAAAMVQVGLDPALAPRPARALSGGQCQRAALARAIALPPPLLLCDEAVSAMDMSLAAAMLNLIGDLRRRLAMGVLFVTHDLGVARIVADRILVMAGGEIVEAGEAEAITRAPHHPETRRLLDAVPGRRILEGP
jgi:peptide/nickel transport system ATP-binding protein